MFSMGEKGIRNLVCWKQAMRYPFIGQFGNPRNGKFFKVYMDFALLLMGTYIAEIE